MSSHAIVDELSPAVEGDKLNLLDLDPKDMQQYFIDLGEKPFRATQILRWIHQQMVTDFDQMTNISKALREDLKRSAQIKVPEVVSDQLSLDGTRKWLLRVNETKTGLPANNIEMVFIPEEGRGTLCVSSQVGCSLDCSFCCTARQGFNRNLSVSEIIGQVWLAKKMLAEANSQDAVTNVVMMGMGEPLHNFKNVVKALHLMMDDNCHGLSKRRVTLSTAGVVPMIDRLREETDVSLAVSLHAPDNELRDKLVPVNQRYPIEELMAACKRYVEGVHKRRITFEYIMLDQINDQPHHARSLAKLLKGIPAKINLIPFNPFPEAGYNRSPDDTIEVFKNILQQKGYVTVTRKTRGEDINAACGQLAGSVKDLSRRHLRFQTPRFGTRQ